MQRLSKNEIGLTLIEVLIALAILSIALTAIIKATAQTIQNTLYLQNRTIATWVGMDVINQLSAGTLKISNHLSQKVTALGSYWTWDATLHETPNKNIKQVIVVVHQTSDEKSFAHLESYLKSG